MDKIFGQENEYICIKALQPGTQIIGLTRGSETKSHHTENLDKGEILVVQFTEKTSAIKVRGNAEVYTKFGVIKAEK
ncbi:MAG: trp RNA-binding attenuation protein MtrB [Clostridia bacterium]|nr:trp RNA-binding attenuation protein MtrB [Clostridia bacterium]